MPHYVVEQIAKEFGESDKAPLPPRIIEAKNGSQALAHVVADTLTVRLAKAADLVAHGKAGREIEVAS